MDTIEVLTTEGKVSGGIDLPEDIFGIEPHEHALWLAVRTYLTNQRQGTASTKGRSEVKASGRKPWRQKGTGRARAGTVASPIWVGGGVVFGPHTRTYRHKLPKKVKRLALKSAFSVKVREGRVVVIEDFSLPEPKTRLMQRILHAIDLNGQKVLFLPGEVSLNLIKSGRNLPLLEIKPAADVCAYDVLNSEVLLLSRSGVERIKEVFSG
ncbi:MAG TPA: 50S ribosomal protein L4 [Candidatus Latescibacteria bacterium]|nr:50S ribosomal protein L4 [Candidatus Latescibacterota bacterium]